MDERRPLLDVGKRFAGALIRRRIGYGGVGEVYEIVFRGTRQALKVVPCPRDVIDAERLADEGRLLLKLRHLNIVEVHECGRTGDLAWIRMELLDGLTLRDFMARNERIPLATACSLLRAATRGAYQCHAFRVIHLDIKPENIFITSDGLAKLLDFGIARRLGDLVTLERGPRGTPLYMAPEQIQKKQVTAATDVYAFGVVAYEVFTGRHPFVDNLRAYDVWALFQSHFDETPRPISDYGVPAEIALVVAKALEKDPRARYQNGLELSDALWSAWTRARERDPSIDAAPAEPRISQPTALDGGGSRRSSAPAKIIVLPPTVRLPDERTSRTASHRGGPSLRLVTVTLPGELRDPTCVRALAEKAAAQSAPREHVGAPLPPDWVSPRSTTPMAAPITRSPVEQALALAAAPEGEPAARPSGTRAKRWVVIPDREAAGLTDDLDIDDFTEENDAPAAPPPPSTPTAAPRVAVSEASRPATHSDRGARVIVAVAYAALLIVFAIGAWAWLSRPSGENGGSPAAPSAQPKGPPGSNTSVAFASARPLVSPVAPALPAVSATALPEAAPASAQPARALRQPRAAPLRIEKKPAVVDPWAGK